MAPKVIEARAIITGEDLLSPLFHGVGRNADNLEKKLVALSKAPPLFGGKRLQQQMQAQVAMARKSQEALTNIPIYRQMKGDFAEGQKKLAAARAALASMRANIAKDSKPTDKMQQAMTKQLALVNRMSAGLDRQKQKLFSLRSSLTGAGVAINELSASEARLAKNVTMANAALDRQAAKANRRANRREALGTAAGLAGVYAGHKTKEFAEKVIHSYAEFDDLRRYQAAILSLTPEQQEPLIQQAIHMSRSRPFNDLQVMHAQLDLAQRGVKLPGIQAVTDASADLAMALGTDLPTAATTLEGILFSTGKNIQDTAAAIDAAKKSASYVTKLSKIGGLSEEDVRLFFKYAGAAGSVAGLSDNTLGAIAAILRKSNIRGDESGVFTRTLSGRLVAPTNQGLAALATMGIDFNSYTKNGPMSANVLAGKVRQDMGVNLSDKQKARIQKLITEGTYKSDDGEELPLISDRGQFTSAISDVISESFSRNKKGKVDGASMKKLAKSVGDFHKLSVESVDTERLLNDIIAANPTLQTWNSMLGIRQGARGAILSQKGLPFFQDYVGQLNAAGDDFHVKIAQERMAGFSGALKMAEASVINFQTAVGRSWDGPLTWVTKTIGGAVQALTELDSTTMKLVTGFGALAGIVGGGWGTMKLFGMLTGGGASVALTGSATALTGSAAALDAAAVALGGKGVLGTAGTAATAAGSAAGGAGATAGAAGAIASGGVAGGGIAAGYLAAIAAATGGSVYTINNYDEESGRTKDPRYVPWTMGRAFNLMTGGDDVAWNASHSTNADPQSVSRYLDQTRIENQIREYERQRKTVEGGGYTETAKKDYLAGIDEKLTSLRAELASSQQLKSSTASQSEVAPSQLGGNKKQEVELKGQADVGVTVNVQPSPMFISTVATKIASQGNIKANTGTSMPQLSGGGGS